LKQTTGIPGGIDPFDKGYAPRFLHPGETLRRLKINAALNWNAMR
jgi:hypothetical protein